MQHKFYLIIDKNVSELKKIGLENLSYWNVDLQEAYFSYKEASEKDNMNKKDSNNFEYAETIEEVYEPFLIQEGFLTRTPRGRQVTKKAYQHLDVNPLNNQKDLFD